MIKRAVFGAIVVSGAIMYSHMSTSNPLNISKTIPEKQIECLASNVYHEARSESMAGQLAVALVTNNRKNDIRFPNTYCDVVKEGPIRESWKTRKLKDIPPSDRIFYPTKHKCQFSWYCNGEKDEPKYDSREWRYAQEYASIVLSGTIVLDVTEGATHYHATYVRPAWAKTKTKTTRIDRHIFYRWEK